MKKYLKLSISAVYIFMLTGCFSSKYNYISDPTPIVKGKTVYSLKNVNVTIRKFGIKISKDDDVKGYLSETDMSKVFRDKITAHLKNKKIFDESRNAEYSVMLNIDYTRNFAINSNKVVSPEFSYEWVVERGGNPVASYKSDKMQFKGIGLLPEWFHTGSSDINPEAESGYIYTISKHIVEKDLCDIGK